jgi:hypothetical protein
MCLFEYERVRFLDAKEEGNIRMEFRFFRIDSQAETLMTAIKDTPEFKGIITAEYGKDPCDPYNRY